MTIGRLVPVPGAPGVVLGKGVDRLPEICISSCHEKIALGRNSITKIGDQFMHRRECTLTVLENGKIAVIDAKNVWINGNPAPSNNSITTLRDGDKISLMDDRYSYLVRYRAERKVDNVLQAKASPRKRSRNQGAAAAVQPPALTGLEAHTPTSTALPKALTEEMYCSLCLELQVEPVAIIPCGHSFCKACAKQVEQCPNCRATIKGQVPNLSFANVISGLASTSLLPYDDIMSFDERTPAQKRVNRKCGRSEEDAIFID